MMTLTSYIGFNPIHISPSAKFQGQYFLIIIIGNENTKAFHKIEASEMDVLGSLIQFSFQKEGPQRFTFKNYLKYWYC